MVDPISLPRLQSGRNHKESPIVSYLTIAIVVFFAPGRVSADLSFEGLVGAVTVDRQVWQRIDLRPRLKMGSVEAAFDLELFFDTEGRIRSRGWDFSSKRAGLESMLRKIYYIQYGKPQDLVRRLYFRVGALSRLTLGNGLIVRDYRNTFGRPGMKRTGVDVQVRGLVWETLTFRGFVSDLKDLMDRGSPLVGGRASATTWGHLSVGATFVVDVDQLAALPDSVRGSALDDSFGVYGIDATLPLLQRRSLFVAAYAGVARPVATTNEGTGFHGPGLRFVAGRLEARAETRFVRGRFEPDHFDALYDQTRAQVLANGTILTHESQVVDADLSGFFVQAAIRDVSAFGFEAAYQHLLGEGKTDRLFRGIVSVNPPMLGPLSRLTLSEFYLEQRVRPGSTVGFLDPTTDTRYGYRVGIRPGGGRISVIWSLEFTYEPAIVGNLERRRTLALQTRFGI